MKKYLPVSFLGFLALAPFSAFAACTTQTGTLCGIVDTISGVINSAIPIAAAVALLMFFWGLAMYLMNFGEGKDDKQRQGRNLMIYGVLVIFVMVSVFGIVRVLQTSFGISNVQNVTAPSIN